eukprot:1193367-Prorocentrum_minimum.AAC.1
MDAIVLARLGRGSRVNSRWAGELFPAWPCRSPGEASWRRARWRGLFHFGSAWQNPARISPLPAGPPPPGAGCPPSRGSGGSPPGPPRGTTAGLCPPVT